MNARTALSMALVAGAAALAVCPEAKAWGPVTQTSIVSAAAHVLDQEPAFNLERMLRYVAKGASVSVDQLNELHPLYEIDPVGAIQREMILLQSLRGDRVDPYYAFRLGVLGKMVASATAPLATVSSSIQDQYYSDVDRAIDGVEMRMTPRKLVDPRPYFSRVRGQAANDDQTLTVDYRGGDGFGSFARSALPGAASRSVNAVADVWYTILTSQVAAFEQPETGRRQYILGAVDFYLESGNLEEVAAVYELAEDQGLMDLNMQKAIGDLYFDAGLYERAIQQYQTVLARDAGRRDVTQRVANYYEVVGDEALEQGNLEEARDAYADALNADSLHPDAQRKLLNVEARIYARDERLLAQRVAVEEAREFENRAEEAAARRDYARAIGLLREAERRYRGVTGEFPSEARLASIGMRNVDIRMREMKSELITNSQSLSGSSFRHNARRLAEQTGDISEEALQQMLRSEYRNAMMALGQQMSQQFIP